MLANIMAWWPYWVVCMLMTVGLAIVVTESHLIRKIIGLNIFQVAIFTLYIAAAKVEGSSAPILQEGISTYANPLPHVLILTAIVVAVGTTAVGLALAVRIHAAYHTLEETHLS